MDERLLREDDYYVAGINESGGTPYCDQLRVREATVEKAAPKLWRLNTIAAGVQLVTALTLVSKISFPFLCILQTHVSVSLPLRSVQTFALLSFPSRPLSSLATQTVLHSL
ncbi:unnamed protein product [Phaeothamnion confervicola]